MPASSTSAVSLSLSPSHRGAPASAASPGQRCHDGAEGYLEPHRAAFWPLVRGTLRGSDPLNTVGPNGPRYLEEM